MLAGALMGVSLVILFVHARIYSFLCDDAFIAFRYARNLANGHGLVFNPGWERVEGYSSVLWVLLLGAGAQVGVTPERLALLLSLAATLALWAIVAAWSWRTRSEGEPGWVAAFAVLLLALTRSIAVWSTGGLETRLFELLVVAGTLRLVAETRARLADEPRRAPLAAVLFALAMATRPDGLLLAACAFLAAGIVLARRGKLHARDLVRSGAILASALAALFAFRLGYYGDWLPNTYRAKVGGRLWFSMGARYLTTFVLEYAVWTWIPLVALGVMRLARAGRAWIAGLFAAVVGPHALYVVAIGGDLFEFRPFDLYFPLVYLVMLEGVRALAATPRRRALAAAVCAVVLVGLVVLPWRAHREFPHQTEVLFPGLRSVSAAEERFLDPSRDAVYRWPGLASLAQAHRNQLRIITYSSVGIRTEESAWFYERVLRQGEAVRELVREGILPADTYLAVGAAGVIPYVADLRVLDRWGLTDRDVARSQPAGARSMGHDVSATFADAQRRQVDLWPVDRDFLVWSVDEPRFIEMLHAARHVRFDAYLADAGNGRYLFVQLPLGAERTASRLPRLQFFPVTDERADEALRAGLAMLRERAETSHDPQARRDLARALEAQGDYAAARAQWQAFPATDVDAAVQIAQTFASESRFREAIPILQAAVKVAPDLGRPLHFLGVMQWKAGDLPAAVQSLEAAMERDPLQPDLRLALAVAYASIGRRDEVEKQRRVLESLDPTLAAGIPR